MKHEPAKGEALVGTSCGQWSHERRSWSRRSVGVITNGLERQRSTELEGGHDPLVHDLPTSTSAIAGLECQRAQEDQICML